MVSCVLYGVKSSVQESVFRFVFFDRSAKRKVSMDSFFVCVFLCVSVRLFLSVCVCYIWVWETTRYSFESLRCADYESMLESHSNSPHLAQIKFSYFRIFTKFCPINHPKSARSLFGHHSLVVWGALIIWTRSDHGLHFWTGVTRQHTHSDGSSALT